jgi:hypothetical protein
LDPNLIVVIIAAIEALAVISVRFVKRSIKKVVTPRAVWPRVILVVGEQMITQDGFFTYTIKYSVISEGTNELTAKLSCDIGPFNPTKYDSVNVIGIPH